MRSSSDRSSDRPTCFACERKVCPGIRCQQTFCPWELKVNKQGYVVLARPLRQRIN